MRQRRRPPAPGRLRSRRIYSVGMDTAAAAIAQGLPEGTLRTSHRETHAVKRKPARREIADKARGLLDGISQHGTIVRQRLDIERMKQPLQKGVFYVAENDGRAETGFLVFLPGQAPVFLQTRPKAPPPCVLRMRVSQVLGEGGGSVLVASLDSVQHTLRLEDVWMWRGLPLIDTTPYSKRRAHLREFVERHWIPDARLMGGIVTTVVNPAPLEAGLAAAGTAHTVDLFPEQPGRRRLWLEVGVRASVRPPGTTADHVQRVTVQSKPATSPDASAQATAPPPAKKIRAAFARPVDKLPDIYDLYDSEGFPISRASVQRFSVSQELRAKPQPPEGVRVQAEWRADFGGYEIVGLI